MSYFLESKTFGVLAESIFLCSIIAIPLFLIALKERKLEPLKALTLVSIAYIFDQIILTLPKVGLFSHLYWNWQGKILETLWPLIIIFSLKWMTPTEAGLNLPKGTFGFKKTFYLSIALIIMTAMISISYEPSKPDTSAINTLLFQFTMPGLSEELLYRGILLGILNRYLDKNWVAWGTRFGWGLIIVSIIFILTHGIGFNPQNHQFSWNLGQLEVSTLVFYSFLFGFIREKTGSIWPGVLLHNMVNGSYRLSVIFLY